MTPEIQKRLNKVAKSLAELHNQRTAGKRTALDQGTKPDLKKLAPTINQIDDKMKAMDKTTTGLLNALNNGNERNVGTLIKTLVKMIDGLSAVKDKGLAMYASVDTRKAALEKSLRRARTTVARAKRQLSL